MLTKAERDELDNLFRAYDMNDDDEYEVHVRSTRLIDLLDRYTEKPKREIQVGDIYRTRTGFLREIDDIDNDITDYPISSRCNARYSRQGEYWEGSRGDLDLSKVYKLVETD